MRYEPRLDGLRAFSVIAVMFFHIWDPTFVGGWIGVDIFFAISGYLITRILTEEWRINRRLDLANFYRNRALRLLPALIAVLIVYSLHCYSTGTAVSTWLFNFLGSLFYAMNWIRAFATGDRMVAHLWSLSIEEQFYLLWPLALPFVLRRRHRQRWVASLLIAVLAWKAVLLLAGASPNRIYNGLDTHADPILIGCLFALGWSPGRLLPALPMMGLMLLFLFVADWQHPLALTFGPAFGGLFAVAMIDRMGQAPGFAPVLAWKPVVYLGRISYGVYLWHYPIVVLYKYTTPYNAVFLLPVATILIAACSYHWLERPFLRMKRPPRRMTAGEAPVSA